MNLSFKRLALALVAAAVLCVGPASSAVAAVPALWTPAGGAKQTGSLELRLNGGSPVICQVNAEGSAAESTFFSSFTAPSPCNNGKSVILALSQVAEKEGTSFHVRLGGSPFTVIDPWGGTFKQGSTAPIPYINGSGLKMSTLQFSNTKLGNSSFGVVTATGTLTSTTWAGGLLTLK